MQCECFVIKFDLIYSETICSRRRLIGEWVSRLSLNLMILARENKHVLCKSFLQILYGIIGNLTTEFCIMCHCVNEIPDFVRVSIVQKSEWME